MTWQRKRVKSGRAVTSSAKTLESEGLFFARRGGPVFLCCFFDCEIICGPRFKGSGVGNGVARLNFASITISVHAAHQR